ncbi:type IV pilus assembly protein PilM [Azohydromonas aeria]|uniref:type IV pilus assembly protein PilM n=1 Tax=Azohydromonas aeria TaxID=2590212 RepID=UPI001E307750|nr:type IV pilus assembly protein PilM [Azohydromonas aeria]
MSRQALLHWLRPGRHPAPLLGVDLGSHGVRLVELGGSAGQPVLACALREPLQVGWIRNGQVEDFDAVAEAVRRAVRRSGTRTRRAALALPAAGVITQRLRLPAGLDGAALEQRVASEAQPQLPFEPEEACLDFCALGPAGEGELEWLVVASRQDRVQDRQGLAEAAGLEPVLLDVESHAVHRAVARLVARWPAPEGEGTGTPAAPVALFDIGAFATTLKLLRGEDGLYERHLPVGGAQFTRLIAGRCGLGFDAAEQAKLAGTLPPDLAPALQADFVDGLAQELARALQIGFASGPCQRVRGVLLAGATATLPGLAPRVSQLTGFETRLADPFDGFTIGLGAWPAAHEAGGFLTACGLALRRFLP